MRFRTTGGLQAADRKRWAVGGAAAVLLTGCASGESAPAPRTDDEKIDVLYAQFQTAVVGSDTAAFLKLICPKVRPKIDPALWFSDGSKLPKPGTMHSVSYTPPDGGEDAPNASQWRKLVSNGSDSTHIRIAKIDADWYVCET